MKFDGKTTEFDIFKEIKNPIEDQSLSSVNMINFLDVQEPIGLKAIQDAKEKGKNILRHNIKSKNVKRRSSTIDAAFKGRKYKQRSYIQRSSYFPT